MLWALDGEVRRVAAAVVAGRPTTDQVAAVLAACATRRSVPVTPAGGSQRRVRRERAGARRGRARPDRASTASSASTASRSWSTSLPGTFGTWLEDDLRNEHGAHRRPLAAVDRPLDRRRLARVPRRRPASTRYGKIEDMVVGLDVVLADGTRHPHRRRARGRGRARPQPGLRRQRGHARRDHAAPGCGSTRSPAAERAGRVRVRDLRGRQRRVPPHHAPRRHARGAAPLRRDRVGPRPRRRRRLVPAARARRGRRGDRRRRRWPSSPRSAAAAASPPTTRSSSSGSSTATTPARSQALTRRATSSTRWRSRRRGHAASRSTRPRPRRCSAVPHARVASCHQCHTYLDGACLYFTFAGHAAARRRRGDLRGVWDAGPRAVLAHGGNLSATTTASGSTAPGSCARRSAPAFAVLRGDQAGARPERHPQSRQARASPTDVRSSVRGREPTAPRPPHDARGTRRAQSRCRWRSCSPCRSRSRPLGCGQPRRRRRSRCGCRLGAAGGVRARRRRGSAWVQRLDLPLIARRSSPRSARTRSPRPCSSWSGCCAGEDVRLVRRVLQPRRVVLGRRRSWAACSGKRLPARQGFAPPCRASVGSDVSILVIDVGTTGLRAAIVDPTRRSPASSYRPFAPDSPFPGLVEFDAAAHGRRWCSTAPARCSRDGAATGRRGRHHQPAGRPRSCGTAPPASRSPRHSAGRTCARSSTASPPGRARHPRSPRTSRPRSSAGSSTPSIPGRDPRPVLRHRRHVGRVGADARARCTSPTAPTRRSPGCAGVDACAWHPACCEALGIPSACCRRSSTPPGWSARRPRCPARRRSPRSSATSRRRSSARAASGPGRPRSRSAPAACSTCASARPAPGRRQPRRRRHVPDRRLEHRRRARRGAPRRSCCRPAPTSSGCATTSACIADAGGEPRRGAAVRRHRRRRLRARAARASAPRTGTTAPAARCSGSPAAPGGRRSCGRCSKASPTAAPTSSRRPRPTPALPIAVLRIDGGMSAQPDVRAGARRRAGEPVEVSPVAEATTLGAGFLAGRRHRRVARPRSDRRQLAPERRGRARRAAAGPGRRGPRP